MEKKRILQILMEAVESGHVAVIREVLTPLHAADIADLLDALPVDYAAICLRCTPKVQAAEVFAYLDRQQQATLIDQLKEEELYELLDRLFIDDRIDVLEELPTNAVQSILERSTVEQRKLYNRYLMYEEDSAGSIMTEEYIRLKSKITVEDAIKKLRKYHEKLATGSTLYVISEDHRLVGVLTIRELLQAEDHCLIESIMHRSVITAQTHDHQEEVVRTMRHYGLSVLPILDSDERLVGVVTVDDAMEISEKETDEDFAIMSGTLPRETSYLKTSAWSQVRSRLPWLLLLLLSGMLNGVILSRFEHAFLALPILVTFIPMLTDAGGNAGSQSSTVIIRGLATGQIQTADWFKVIASELKTSLLTGSALGLLAFLRCVIFLPQSVGVGAVVALSVLAIVVMSKLLGGILPIAANAIGLDPALMAAPIITTLVDAGGLIVFFAFAHWILAI